MSRGNYYFLRKESYEIVIPEMVRQNGEVIPERVLETEDRALYFLPKYPRRRYRTSYPNPASKNLKIYKCKSLKHILEERKALFDYCGEWFDIYDQDNFKVELNQNDQP
jgi:hypothetical protein